ncbi:MAG: hypothetical protein PT965_00620 [Clostridia bacterium]|nr:hypothetical protein [Clostridia bacterium]MDY2928955.1 hypothetical protein [Clostridiaceae bacterium]
MKLEVTGKDGSPLTLTDLGGGRFAPEQSCTRGQIVTFLYRASR